LKRRNAAVIGTIERRGGGTMDYKLELMQIPVTDVDRAKAFYLDRVGCSLVVDTDGR
jgi:hypothetical protein